MTTTTMAQKHFNEVESLENGSVSEWIALCDDVDAETTSDDLMVIGFKDGSKLRYSFRDGWLAHSGRSGGKGKPCGHRCVHG